MRERGYENGRNITLEYRFSDGDNERFPALAAELVRLKVDVIFAGGNLAVRAAKQATSTIPIVGVVSDPIKQGFAVTLARPGGNFTGVSVVQEELGGKWIELLKEMLPNLKQAAVLSNPQNPAANSSVELMHKAAASVGIKLHVLYAGSADQFEDAFAAMAKERLGALVVNADAMFTSESRRLVQLANRNRLPAVFQVREFVEAGGLMSYGPDVTEMIRQAAGHVDRILKGAKPGDLPIELPTKFNLVINMKTARALGIKIPQSLLLRAERVIE